MKVLMKKAPIILLLLTLTTTEAKLTKEETDGANDEKYQSLIIGRWVEDKEQQQIMN
ncbi:hypothetical protein [Marinicella meishanensis]|uniref:hypothetical protein n=1 Tax=Marinicella meishanensis TaxID=2873263 RepID=UPI001CBC375C|nr:hypothetical protein [Marinicella sp. NBU2979]